MYSQKKEDHHIWAYFKDKEPGNFLDIGANDGKVFSNSLWLIEHGWGGVMVEPSPKTFERLKENHGDNPKLHLMNFAITDKDEEIDFYESGSVKITGRAPNIGLVSTTKHHLIGVWENRVLFEKIRVQSKSFKTFLEESPLKKFEFITTDTEGQDFNILKQMDLNALGCQFICIEHDKETPPSEFINYIKPQGFREIAQTSVNVLMAK